jgi:ATP-dependent DNA helicase RecQ
MKGAQLPPASLSDLQPRRAAAPASRITVDDSGRRIVPVGREDYDEAKGNGADVALSADAAKRFERLRAVRLRLARQQDVPAYVICNDATLKLIAEHAPPDVQSLEQVKGMGPYKVKAYGSAFLEAISDA